MSQVTDEVRAEASALLAKLFPEPLNILPYLWVHYWGEVTENDVPTGKWWSDAMSPEDAPAYVERGGFTQEEAVAECRQLDTIYAAAALTGQVADLGPMLWSKAARYIYLSAGLPDGVADSVYLSFAKDKLPMLPGVEAYLAEWLDPARPENQGIIVVVSPEGATV